MPHKSFESDGAPSRTAIQLDRYALRYGLKSMDSIMVIVVVALFVAGCSQSPSEVHRNNIEHEVTRLIR